MTTKYTKYTKQSMHGLFVCLVCFVVSLSVSADRPNFLLFLADDCSWHDFGCYGNRDVKTPNIDALAQRGMRFMHCYNSAPMCAPTRMSLFTGLHPVRNGGHPNHSRVYDHVKSVPHYLRPLGYDVALIGKTHHAPPENFPFDFLGGVHHDTGKGVDLELGKIDEYLGARGDKPFCLMVQSNQPHAPWTRGDASVYHAKKLALPPYMVDTPETREAMTKYYAEITYMDSQLGYCLQSLEKHGLEKNTLVVFLSEQGSNFPHCKWTCYDSGLRSAGIFQWLEQVEPSVSEAMIQYVDILPTFIELAGGNVESNDFDGKSLVPVLAGTSDKLHDYVFGMQTTRGIHAGSDAYGIRTVRDKRFRLIWNLNPEGEFRNSVTKGFKPFKSWEKKAQSGDAFAKEQVSRYRKRPEFELYDMEKDPFEMHNLAGNPEYNMDIARLKKHLDNWMEQQGDRGRETEMAALERKHSDRH
ncbi:Choline-sulfatase [Pontiella desulfatans]|uniref:Choline-sulfatase n=1 Tax=Pontiella desulfatans TaxID=2750659 RepID=A0A6C2U061_PONDE|nr:sulfatase [Pontiella desulfatans]SPS73790.1 sulfatase S1_8 [Kiritimatiellales bacterium]VGO13340.1 Choline-sulfatase [Pontiella desulfatans]